MLILENISEGPKSVGPMDASSETLPPQFIEAWQSWQKLQSMSCFVSQRLDTAQKQQTTQLVLSCI